MLSSRHRPLPQAQLEQAGSMAEVLSGVQRMKALMVVNGLQPGAQTYAAQLRAALRLQELQVGAGTRAGQAAVRPVGGMVPERVG